MSVASRVLLWIKPDGWQARSRRNAWAAMVADRQRRAERAAVKQNLRTVIPTPRLRVLTR
jgi:hypothetical protein